MALGDTGCRAPLTSPLRSAPDRVLQEGHGQDQGEVLHLPRGVSGRWLPRPPGRVPVRVTGAPTSLWLAAGTAVPALPSPLVGSRAEAPWPSQSPSMSPPHPHGGWGWWQRWDGGPGRLQPPILAGTSSSTSSTCPTTPSCLAACPATPGSQMTPRTGP